MGVFVFALWWEQLHTYVCTIIASTVVGREGRRGSKYDQALERFERRWTVSGLRCTIFTPDWRGVYSILAVGGDVSERERERE